MSDATTKLTIVGAPNEEVQVIYRGNRDDDPPPPIWVGKLDGAGRATIDVPQAYLVVLSESGTVPIRLFENPRAAETVHLTGAN